MPFECLHPPSWLGCYCESLDFHEGDSPLCPKISGLSQEQTRAHPRPPRRPGTYPRSRQKMHQYADDWSCQDPQNLKTGTVSYQNLPGDNIKLFPHDPKMMRQTSGRKPKLVRTWTFRTASTRGGFLSRFVGGIKRQMQSLLVRGILVKNTYIPATNKGQAADGCISPFPIPSKCE